MSRLLRFKIVTLAILLGVGVYSRVEASPIVFVDPSTKTVAPGETFTVDIKVSGLTSTVSGYSFLLEYDATAFDGSDFGSGSSVNLAPLGPTPDDLSLFGPGSFDVFTNADAATSQAVLDGLQGGGAFTLATLQLTAKGTAAGLYSLNLVYADFSPFDPSPTQPNISADVQGGTVCVAPAGSTASDCLTPVPVPEPATLTLLGLGVSALVARRRRRPQVQ